MRKGFVLAFLVSLLFGGGYFYYIAQAVCPVPMSYSIGEIDDRFDLSKDEARLALSDAESVWEDATGKNLFSYEDEGGTLSVNFVYDQRQEFVNAEGELKEKLDATQNISDAIGETYAALVKEYNELRITYATRVEDYERRLSRYNDEVEKYNRQGGAPADVYGSLTKEKQSLNREQTELNDLAGKLNSLVTDINNVGEKGNKIVSNYNQGVNVYNETFGESHEFTQGDYSNHVIKIYTFEDKSELQLVLEHEFGHALSLDHVDGVSSIMHYLIKDQPEDGSLSKQDLSEFNRVCGEQNLLEKIKVSLGITA